MLGYWFIMFGKDFMATFNIYESITDLAKMAEVVSISSAHYKSRSQLQLGNLAWRLKELDLTKPVSSIAIWHAKDSNVKSFAIVHDKRPADLQLLPKYASDITLLREMVAWIEKVTISRDTKISCLSSATALEAVLADQGYIRNPVQESYVRMERDLSRALVGPELGAEYRMQSMSKTSASNSLVEAHNEVFPGSILTSGDYSRTDSTKLGLHDFRFVLVDPASIVVAFSFSWLDTKSACLEFEPVGCCIQLRRKKLGTYLLMESMRSARALGAKWATLTTRSSSRDAINFYRSLQFEQTDVEYVFSKAEK